MLYIWIFSQVLLVSTFELEFKDWYVSQIWFWLIITLFGAVVLSFVFSFWIVMPIWFLLSWGILVGAKKICLRNLFFFPQHSFICTDLIFLAHKNRISITKILKKKLRNICYFFLVSDCVRTWSITHGSVHLRCCMHVLIQNSYFRKIRKIIENFARL